jgi:hypothetical protein
MWAARSRIIRTYAFSRSTETERNDTRTSHARLMDLLRAAADNPITCLFT